MKNTLKNFTEIANKFPKLYGDEGSKKRGNVKYYIKNNPSSEKMEAYKTIELLYIFKKNNNCDKRDERVYIKELTTENSNLKKEIKTLKNELKELKEMYDDLIH